MARIDTTIRRCKTFEEFQDLMRKYWERLSVVVNNLPAPTSVAATTPVPVNTDFVLTHNLGYVPSQFTVVSKSAAVDVWKSPTAATETEITLRANVGNVDIVVQIA